MENQDQIKDEWEIALDKAIQELKECQEKHDTTDCFECSEMIGCQQRQEYVRAVYESMNKGAGGGFEF